MEDQIKKEKVNEILFDLFKTFYLSIHFFLAKRRKKM